MKKQEYRNCPQCLYWWFDRIKRGCSKDHKLTNTTYMICCDPNPIGPCKDFHDKKSLDFSNLVTILYPHDRNMQIFPCLLP